MKKALGFLLALSLVFCLISSHTLADDSGKINSLAYATYFDYLQQRIDEDGLVAPSSVKVSDGFAFPQKTGVYYARIIDLDQDGIDELYCIESKYKRAKISEESSITYDDWDLFWYLYAFQNGTLTLIKSDEFTVLSDFGFTKGKDGKCYYAVKSDSYSGVYYGLDNGILSINSLSVVWSYDVSISGVVNGESVWVHSDDMHSSLFSYNGEFVDYNTFMEKHHFFENEIEYYSFYNRVPDEGTQETLKVLSNGAPRDYIFGYKTPSEWAKASIDKGIAIDVIPAELLRKYNQPITRADFCKLAAQYYEVTTNTKISERAVFSDTSELSVQKMGGMGIINGIGDGLFNPNGVLTREAAATILVRMANALGIEMPYKEPTFSDNNEIAPWAYDAVGIVQSMGLMNGTGDNHFSPKGQYTREQGITTILRLIDLQPALTSLSLQESELVLLIGADRKLSPIITFEKTTANKTLLWTTSDEKVVTVDKHSGSIHCVEGGIATITVTSSNGLTANCTVSVIHPTTRIYADLPVTIECPAQNSMGRPSGASAGTVTITTIKPSQFVEGMYTIIGEISSHGAETHGSRISYDLIDKSGNILTTEEDSISFSSRMAIGTEISFSVIIPSDIYLDKNEFCIMRFHNVIS